MKHILLLIWVVIMSGCTTTKLSVQKEMQNTAVVHDEAYKKEIAAQALKFFEEHPEYMNSEEQEAQLFTLYQGILKDPKHQGLSLYQMLLVTHTQLLLSR